MFNYKTVAKEILLQIRESFQGHPTRIITYLVLRLYKLLASWFVSAQILTMNISRSPEGGSLVHLLSTADLWTLVQFSKSLCSPQWTKRSRIHAGTLRVTNTNCVSHEACMVFLLCDVFVSIWQFSRWTTWVVVTCCLRKKTWKKIIGNKFSHEVNEV